MDNQDSSQKNSLVTPPLAQVQLVLFDLDGTLIDSLPQLWQAVNQMLTALEHDSVDQDSVRGWVGNGADMLVTRALSTALQRAPNADEQAQGRAGFDRAYGALAEQEVVLYPGVKATLQQLVAAGKTLALVTNKPSVFVPDILESTGLAPYFSAVLGGDCLPQKKPDPTPLLHICQQLDIAPQYAVMVGDSENDVLAAQGADIAVVGLTYGYNYGRPIADSQPNWVLNELPSLLDLVLSKKDR